MADSNAMHLKVFLRNGNGVDVRRFTVDAQVATSFTFMREKLQVVFPTLRNYQFKITWKDSDEDEVTIASDEDFIIALTEMSANVKVLYVTVLEQFPDPMFAEDAEEPTLGTFPYPRVVCDVCEQIITGLRYKCIQCPDYDLCAACSHKGLHNQHLMLRVPNSITEMPKYARKFMHCVSRNLKRTASSAQKEMHRAAKHCGRFHGTNATDEGKAKGEPRARSGHCSQNETGTSGSKGGCPFTGDGFTMKDVHTLGSMAKEQLGPILEAISNTASGVASATSNNNNQQQGGELITDLLRNVMQGFFGQEAASSDQDSQAKPTEDANSNAKKSSTTNRADAPTQTQTESVPMDVEGHAADKNATVEKLQEATTSNPNDPGWIFIPSSSQSPQPQPQLQPLLVTPLPQQGFQSAAMEQQNQASAPILISDTDPVIAEGLARLHEMGFENRGGLLTILLKNYGGNVSEVVKRLVEMRN